jgi:hypothetical protein
MLEVSILRRIYKPERGVLVRAAAAVVAAGFLLAQFGFTASAGDNTANTQYAYERAQDFLSGAANTGIAADITTQPQSKPTQEGIATVTPAAPAAPSATPGIAATQSKEKAAVAAQKTETKNKKMVGFHSLVYNRQNLAALADFAVRYLAPMGVNTLIVEIDDRFQFKSHPELSGGDITAADARAFSKKVKAAGMDVVPLYECLGHQGAGGERDALLTAHPELDETPWVGRDAGLPEFYTPAWCASNDTVYDYVLPAIDELISAFGATTFHVGMDEVFEIGLCDKCKDTPKSVLFAQTVKRLHDHLAAEGVKMMMWGDRLLDGKVINHTWEADVLGTHGAISKIPKDIIIADWHYERTKYPSVGIFLDKGFSVLPACWKDPVAAVNFLKSAEKQAASRGKQSAMMGMLITDWGVMPTDLAHAMNAPYNSLNSNEKGLRDTLKAVMKSLAK